MKAKQKSKDLKIRGKRFEGEIVPATRRAYKLLDEKAKEAKELQVITHVQYNLLTKGFKMGYWRDFENVAGWTKHFSELILGKQESLKDRLLRKYGMVSQLKAA